MVKHSGKALVRGGWVGYNLTETDDRQSEDILSPAFACGYKQQYAHNSPQTLRKLDFQELFGTGCV